MGRSAIGLQLALLVAGGVASGYLWRAALEADSTVRYVSAAQPFDPPALVRPNVTWNIVVLRPSSRRHAARLRRAVPVRSKAASVTQAQLAVSRTVPSAAPQASRVPAHGSSPTPRSRPPASPPPPASPAPPPPPPAASPPAPPPPSPPPVSPTPPPPPVTPTPPPPPASESPGSHGGTRPGWGHGDRNHSHTGPPGRSKK